MTPHRIAEGVWLLRGGYPGRRFVNVYLIEDEDGVTIFDCGIRQMALSIRAAAKQFGGAGRIVLGHAHADHRGAAALMGLPVLCHPLEQPDVEGDGGQHYFTHEGMIAPQRILLHRLLKSWDAGPVPVSGLVREGDPVGDFRVVEVPGHSPGQIALYREHDGVALTSDCFYTVDIRTFRYTRARVTHEGVNLDTDQARRSIRKLADLQPSAAWPGHAGPVKGNVRSELIRAATRKT